MRTVAGSQVLETTFVEAFGRRLQHIMTWCTVNYRWDWRYDKAEFLYIPRHPADDLNTENPLNRKQRSDDWVPLQLLWHRYFQYVFSVQNSIKTSCKNDVPFDGCRCILHFFIQSWVTNQPCCITYISTYFIQSLYATYNQAFLCIR